MSGITPPHPYEPPEIEDDLIPAPGSELDVYVIHASCTTCLHTETAHTESDALGKWAGRHGIRGRLACAEATGEPFAYLSARIVPKGGDAITVHVIQERELERRTAAGGDYA